MKLSILSSSDLQQDSTLSHDSLMASSSLPFKATKDDIFQIIKIRNKKKWTPEEDSYLIQLASCYQEKHWKIIAEHFKHKNSLQCFSRYKRINLGVVKGHWTTSEDNEILSPIDNISFEIKSDLRLFFSFSHFKSFIIFSFSI